MRIYRWLKMRWYRRQAKRAVWFLRYMDSYVHQLGWGRAKINQFWVDFHKHPEARRLALNQISAINKITIREERRSKMEKALDWLVLSNQKLQLELNKKNAELAKCSTVADKMLDALSPRTAGPTGSHGIDGAHGMDHYWPEKGDPK